MPTQRLHMDRNLTGNSVRVEKMDSHGSVPRI